MRNENSHTNALATLTTICEANNNRVITVTILTKASMEEVEKAVGNIYMVNTLQFTSILIFLKDEGLLEDKKKMKEIKSKVKYYMI